MAFQLFSFVNESESKQNIRKQLETWEKGVATITARLFYFSFLYLFLYFRLFCSKYDLIKQIRLRNIFSVLQITAKNYIIFLNIALALFGCSHIHFNCCFWDSFLRVFLIEFEVNWPESKQILWVEFTLGRLFVCRNNGNNICCLKECALLCYRKQNIICVMDLQMY